MLLNFTYGGHDRSFAFDHPVDWLDQPVPLPLIVIVHGGGMTTSCGYLRVSRIHGVFPWNQLRLTGAG